MQRRQAKLGISAWTVLHHIVGVRQLTNYVLHGLIITIPSSSSTIILNYTAISVVTAAHAPGPSKVSSPSAKPEEVGHAYLRDSTLPVTPF